MIRSLLAAGCLLTVVGCAGKAPATVATGPSVPPRLVCPPDPPAGSGLACAPPRVCKDAAGIADIAQGPLGVFLSAPNRAGINHFALGIQDIVCKATL